MLESATDSLEADELIYQVIEKEFPGSTVLIIALHLRKVVFCDRVLVMEAGRVLEFDSPSALLADQDSNLRKMLAEGEGINRRI